MTYQLPSNTSLGVLPETYYDCGKFSFFEDMEGVELNKKWNKYAMGGGDAPVVGLKWFEDYLTDLLWAYLTREAEARAKILLFYGKDRYDEMVEYCQYCLTRTRHARMMARRMKKRSIKVTCSLG